MKISSLALEEKRSECFSLLFSSAFNSSVNTPKLLILGWHVLNSSAGMSKCFGLIYILHPDLKSGISPRIVGFFSWEMVIENHNVGARNAHWYLIAIASRPFL